MLDRMDQRDAAKGCTDLLALFGISDAPGQEASARLPRAAAATHLAALAEIAGPVIAHRHHGITVGVAHYEVRAARAAAAAHRRGMSHEDIASAMGLSVADIRAWLTSPTD